MLNSKNQLSALVLGLITTTPGFARNYIVGGADVLDSDPIRSSTVALYEPEHGGSGGSLCTASLIAKDMALTAAHCVKPGGSNPILLFGRDLHAQGTEKRPVTAVAVNPKWETHAGRGMDQGDIAVVRFPGGIPAGYIKASTLKSDSGLKSGEAAILAGYGISNAQTKTGAGSLRRATVEIADPRPGKSEMILDQTHGRGACHGDSGGPAFVTQNGKILLAGVTNRGYPDRAPDDCAHHVVYTKYPAYRSWIQKSEAKLRSEKAPQIYAKVRDSSAKRDTTEMKHRVAKRKLQHPTYKARRART